MMYFKVSYFVFLFLFSYVLLFQFKQETFEGEKFIYMNATNMNISEELSINQSNKLKDKGILEFVIFIWMVSLIIEELKEVMFNVFLIICF